MHRPRGCTHFADLAVAALIAFLYSGSGLAYFQPNNGFQAENIPIHDSPRGQSEIASLNDLTISQKARNYFRSGIQAVHAAHWRKAIDAFSNALRIDPHYAKAYNGLGVALAITGKIGLAEEAFRNAIRFDEKLAEAHFNLGKLLLETSRPLEAEVHLQHELNLDMRNASAVQLLVECMLSTHEEDSGVALMKSLHLKKIMHSAFLHMAVGHALEDHTRFELAAEQYSLALNELSSDTERREAEAALSRVTSER